MPTIVRLMFHDNGVPRIDSRRDCLWARPDVDVTVKEGLVELNGNGISVNDCLDSVPHFLRPKTEDNGMNGADGSSKRKLFTHGDGAFTEGAVAAGLTLHYKTRDDGAPILTAGNVAPDSQMTLAAYQAALAATQQDWR